ncbi:MAG: DUF4426 domain-containing protein [Gammaproteobacteria bacterium]|nr:DUF4426 domain-containing protein [Gammaproteobacteria bacterium]
MNCRKSTLLTALLLGSGALALSACSPPDVPTSQAEDGRKRLNAGQSYAQFGDYVIHVNAMTSDGLTPDIAQSYGITRSEDLGLINLVVLKKSDEPGIDTPVTADVKLTTANLTGQLKTLKLQEIRDDVSIYYIGTVNVENRETINFDFDIRPAGSDRTLLARYSHEFYTR